MSRTDETFWIDVLDARFSGHAEEYTLGNASVSLRLRSGDLQRMLAGTDLHEEDAQQRLFGEVVGPRLPCGTSTPGLAVRWRAMERLYRTMRAGLDGLPVVERSARALGVRVAGEFADIRADRAGNVSPGGGGMSVTVDDPAAMPRARRPRWVPGGASEDPLFYLGSESVSPPLALRVDHDAHALVEPHAKQPLTAYEAAVAATRPGWIRVVPEGRRSS